MGRQGTGQAEEEAPRIAERHIHTHRHRDRDTQQIQRNGHNERETNRQIENHRDR